MDGDPRLVAFWPMTATIADTSALSAYRTGGPRGRKRTDPSPRVCQDRRDRHLRSLCGCPVVSYRGAVSSGLSFATSELSTCIGASAQLRRCQRVRRVPAPVDLFEADRVLLPAEALALGADILRAEFGRTRTVSSRFGLSSVGVTSSRRSGLP
jgi:hypothetical protein